MITAPAPQLVDQQGNINLQGRCGQAFGVQVLDGETGLPMAISNWTLVFEIDGIATIALTNGATATWKTLIIPDSVVQRLPLQGAVAWVLKDATVSGVSPALRFGAISAIGFTAAPPS